MSHRVFVAGGTGVLGRRAVPLLVETGHDVTVSVRSDAKAAAVFAAGATPARVDLFDAAALTEAVDGHDTVVNLATAIPTGAAAARKSAWTTNDRIRSEAARNLAGAVPDGGRYVGESLTFPYVASGDRWIDESVEQTFWWGTRSVVDAEAAARSVTERGSVGVTLRFAMFWAVDSAHMQTVAGAARPGIWPIPGDPGSFISWIHADDAARAVVAALGAPAGVYNVAEPDPLCRVAHRDALAAALGRDRLRGIPRPVERFGGASVASIARSHRISSAALAEATGWSPRHRVVDNWPELVA